MADKASALRSVGLIGLVYEMYCRGFRALDWKERGPDQNAWAEEMRLGNGRNSVEVSGKPMGLIFGRRGSGGSRPCLKSSQMNRLVCVRMGDK